MQVLDSRESWRMETLICVDNEEREGKEVVLKKTKVTWRKGGRLNLGNCEKTKKGREEEQREREKW